MKIYIAPHAEPGFTTLQADVGTWKQLLALRPAAEDEPVIHQAADNEAMSDADWRYAARAVARAIGDRDDDAVVRVRLRSGLATGVVEMARAG